MYYAETIIDGRLYCRYSPDAEWKLASIEAVTRRLLQVEKDLDALRKDYSLAYNRGQRDAYRYAAKELAKLETPEVES